VPEALRQLPPITRRVIMQKARHHPLRREGSDCLQAFWFQVLFHSPPGVLFTFPSRYWFTIGGGVYLALEGGPPRFPQGSSCPVVLGYQCKVRRASRTGLSPSLARRSRQLPSTSSESLFLGSPISADLRLARSPLSVKREEQAPSPKREEN
jgi:hypothetical protein